MLLCPTLNCKVSPQIVLVIVNLKAVKQCEAQSCNCWVANKDNDETGHLNVEFQINFTVLASFHDHSNDQP